MANWSVIGALGEASKSAGNYFGVLSKEKLTSERLAEARANKVADTEDARAYQEQTAEANRVQGLEDQEAARLQSIEDNLVTTAASNAENDRRKNVTAEIADRDIGENEEEWKPVPGQDIETDTDGNKHIMVTNGKTTEYHPIGMGGAARTNKLGEKEEDPVEFVPDADLKLNTDQAKTYGFYARGIGAQAEMEQLLKTAGLAEVSSDSAAVWRQLPMPQLIKGVFQGKESEAYENIVRRMYTAILRKDSGATLNDDEIAEMKSTYMIQAGNSPELIARKMDNLKRDVYNLGDQLPANAKAKADADLAGRETTSYLGDPEPVSGSPATALPQTADDYMKSLGL